MYLQVFTLPVHVCVHTYIIFLCAVQLQHLVEVILVGVGGGGAYLQVCVVQVVAARWLRGGAR